jgi:hypothetical protein
LYFVFEAESLQLFPGWSGAQDPPVFASKELGLQAFTTTGSFNM